MPLPDHATSRPRVLVVLIASGVVASRTPAAPGRPANRFVPADGATARAWWQQGEHRGQASTENALLHGADYNGAFPAGLLQQAAPVPGRSRLHTEWWPEVITAASFSDPSPRIRLRSVSEDWIRCGHRGRLDRRPDGGGPVGTVVATIILLAVAAVLFRADGRLRLILVLLACFRGLQVVSQLIGLPASYAGILITADLIVVIMAVIWLVRHRLTPTRLAGVAAVLLISGLCQYRHVITEPRRRASLRRHGSCWCSVTPSSAPT